MLSKTISNLNENMNEIGGINQPTIEKYFQTINQEKFLETAQLFIENGTLIAPFESPIFGRENIAKYLAAEAKGMKLLPQQATQEQLEEDCSLFKVKGKVKTSLFSVNVSWNFQLSLESQIIEARIKLLASPQELLKIRPRHE